MTKIIRQFRYYNNKKNINNFPFDITEEKLVSGKIFKDKNCFPITKIRIQSLPGIKFYLNNGKYPIVINNTGIYELDLKKQMEIYNINIESLSMKRILDDENGYLIIDMTSYGSKMIK